MSDTTSIEVHVDDEAPEVSVNWKPIPEGFGLAEREHFRWADRVLLTPEGETGDDFKKEGSLFLQGKSLPVGIVVEPEHVAGRRVLYRQYHGDMVVVNGEAYLIVEPNHIVLFLSDDDEVEEVGNA